MSLNKTSLIRNKQSLGKKVGHIAMLQRESIKINTKYDLWLAEKILNYPKIYNE